MELLQNDDFVKFLAVDNEEVIKELTAQIKRIEKKIKEIIKQDKDLSKTEKQMRSVAEVGEILCWSFLVKTNKFNTITDPRKFACYSGVLPFENSSGTSIFGRNRVSIFADKTMKKLLHMGVLSAIRMENDLAIYYRRKVEEGKNKMAVLNALRNKIIHIIFALIKNQNFYQNRLLVS